MELNRNQHHYYQYRPEKRNFIDSEHHQAQQQPFGVHNGREFYTTNRQEEQGLERLFDEPNKIDYCNAIEDYPLYNSWASSGLKTNGQNISICGKMPSPITVVPADSLGQSYRIFEGSPYDDFVYRRFEKKKFKFNSLHSSPVSRRSPICAIHKHPSFHSIETNI